MYLFNFLSVLIPFKLKYEILELVRFSNRNTAFASGFQDEMINWYTVADTDSHYSESLDLFILLMWLWWFCFLSFLMRLIAGDFGSHAHIVFAFGLQISEILECFYPFQLIINWLIILSNCLFLSGTLINRNKSENEHYGIIFPQRWKFFSSMECLSTHQRHSHHHMRQVTIILAQRSFV